MSGPQDIDGVLVQWGERLFYPANQMVRGQGQPRFGAASMKDRAAWVRARIAATAARRAPQVMVKITGGGRGMTAIAAHLRYISKGGRLQSETDTGEIVEGKDAVRELAEEWRVGGTLIDADSPRRDALNVVLSMPRGTDPLAVQRAAREFAKLEFADHKYVMVLHEHQANPHVHVSVRRESRYGKRINPRKADLQRWRETFAERLREWGVEAEASRQATRGISRGYPAIWQVKAKEEGRLRNARSGRSEGTQAGAAHENAKQAWSRIAVALASSSDPGDRQLASSVRDLLGKAAKEQAQPLPERSVTGHEPQLGR